MNKQAIRKEFEGAITEIGANKALTSHDPYNEGWNAGAEMAIRFIRRYINGTGLFQDDLEAQHNNEREAEDGK